MLQPLHEVLEGLVLDVLKLEHATLFCFLLVHAVGDGVVEVWRVALEELLGDAESFRGVVLDDGDGLLGVVGDGVAETGMVSVKSSHKLWKVLTASWPLRLLHVLMGPSLQVCCCGERE